MARQDLPQRHHEQNRLIGPGKLAITTIGELDPDADLSDKR